MSACPKQLQRIKGQEYLPLVSIGIEGVCFLELRRLNGTPKAVLEQEELMQIMIPLLRADFAVGETYAYAPDTPESLLSCPISAFGGLQDPEASRQELEAWGEQTSATFSLHMFAGDHFFLHSAESLLLKILSQQLHTLAQSLG
jgi:medium-chain acyl-[acyl-carrier-protein] hydrolase